MHGVTIKKNKAVYLLFCKFTLHVSGVNHTQPNLTSGVHKTVTTASGTGHIFVHPKHVE